MSDYLATRLSTHQLATLWGELIEAYHGVNSFGGDTAEIYAYTLVHPSPTADSRYADSETGASARLELAREAGLALDEVMRHFIRHHDDCSVEVDGESFGGGVVPFNHRVHVRIVRRK